MVRVAMAQDYLCARPVLTTIMNIEDIESRRAMADKPVPSRHIDKNQQWAVLSIVAPQYTNQTAPEMAMRIHGCKPDLQSAKTWARAIRDSNDFFDVLTCPTNEWVPLPPKLTEIEDINYTDKRVQDIHDSYIEHLSGQKRDLIERLEDLDVNRQKQIKAEGEAADAGDSGTGGTTSSKTNGRNQKKRLRQKQLKAAQRERSSSTAAVEELEEDVHDNGGNEAKEEVIEEDVGSDDYVKIDDDEEESITAAV